MRGCILPKDSTGIRLQGGSWGGSWKPQYELLAVLLSPPQCLYSHTLNQLLPLLFGAPIPNPRDPWLEHSVVTAPGALSIPQAPVGLGSALEGSSGSSSGGSRLAPTRTAECCGLDKMLSAVGWTRGSLGGGLALKLCLKHPRVHAIPHMETLVRA